MGAGDLIRPRWGHLPLKGKARGDDWGRATTQGRPYEGWRQIADVIGETADANYGVPTGGM